MQLHRDWWVQCSLSTTSDCHWRINSEFIAECLGSLARGLPCGSISLYSVFLRRRKWLEMYELLLAILHKYY
jgi:hypothetical protein